jgi:hypothetical protein
MMTRSVIGASAFAFLFMVSLAAAQQPPPVHAHGTIESVTGSTLVLKQDGAPNMTIKIADDAKVFGVVPATIADIKIGDFIAVGAMPQPDGSQKAIMVNIFAEALRGVGEGFRPWDRPGSTMTNATVDTTVAGVNGQVVTVKYKGGEQKIIIDANTPIRKYVPGDRAELKAGAHMAIPRGEKMADGTVQAGRFYVGRDGVIPQ